MLATRRKGQEGDTQLKVPSSRVVIFTRAHVFRSLDSIPEENDGPLVVYKLYKDKQFNRWQQL